MSEGGREGGREGEREGKGTHHDDRRLHYGELVPNALAGAASEGEEGEVGGHLVGVQARHARGIVACPVLESGREGGREGGRKGGRGETGDACVCIE